MLKQPFLISSLAIFMVFSLLLVSLMKKVYQKEEERPTIYHCLTYQGDFDALNQALEIEHGYVDYFVVLELNPEKKIVSDQRTSLLKKYPEKVILVRAFNSSEKKSYLKGLQQCSNRDIILLSNSTQAVPFKDLYRSLGELSSHPSAIYSLKALNLNKTSLDQPVQATTYQNLKEKFPDSFEKPLLIKGASSEKRRLFFQTTPEIYPVGSVCF